MKDPYNIFYAVILSCCTSRNVAECNEDPDFLQELVPLDVAANPSEIIQFWTKHEEGHNAAHEELIVRRSDGNIPLRMKRSSVLRHRTSIYLLRAAGIIEQLHNNIIDDVVKLYENPSLFSTVAHAVDQYGNPYFVGSIAGRKIAPISKREARSLQKEKPHLFAQTLEPGSVDGEFMLSNYYGVHNFDSPENSTIFLPPLGRPYLFQKGDKSYRKEAYKRLKRSTANIIYPEVLLILDYNQKYTSIYEFRFLNLIMYSITFWNSVNLRFRSLQDPEVRLKITGIVVTMERDALPFLKDNIVADRLEVRKVISSLRDWTYKYIHTPYDIVLLQTTLQLQLTSYKGELEKLTGVAYTGATCNDDTPSWMVGIIHDKMHYSGVNVAAHEIGHILGASHDSADSPVNCLNTKNYIMTDLGTVDDFSPEWSQCSKDDLSHMLRLMMGDCLDNENPSNDQGELIDVELLPGGKLSLKEQCIQRGYADACGIAASLFDVIIGVHGGATMSALLWMAHPVLKANVN